MGAKRRGVRSKGQKERTETNKNFPSRIPYFVN